MMNPSESKFSVHAAKSIALLGMFLSVLALCGPESRGEEEPLPAAETILDRYIQALGGKALIEKIENRVSQGYMEVPSIGLKGSFIKYEAKPNLTFSIMEIPGFGKEKKGTNEDVVWSYTSMRGYKLTQGDKKEASLQRAMMDRMVDWKNYYKTAECLGSEEVEGRSCYKVNMTPFMGDPETWYFDQQNHLPVRTDVISNTLMGKMPFAHYFKDYKKVDGLLVRHKEESRSSQKHFNTVNVYEKIEHNKDLPDGIFDLPPGVEKLLAEAGKTQIDDKATLKEKAEWVKEHALVFNTVEAENGLEDLMPLKEMIGDARIVSLGEGTHGTREFFQMKHRLLEFLAKEMGFTIFSIEANMPESYRVSDYVLHGQGNPEEMLDGMYFWTFNTEEVLEMIQWMRTYNETAEADLSFTGFDMQAPDVAMQIVADFIEEHDPDYAAEVMEIFRKIKLSKKSEAADLCGDLVTHLESSKKDYQEKTDPHEVEWALQNARVVQQCFQMSANQVHRDLSMARNVQWILDQAPSDTKIVLWAHNGHVNKVGESMGNLLHQWYGDDMVVIGFSSSEGRYTAMGEKQLESHELQSPEPDSLDFIFQQTGLPRFVLDLRKALAEDPASVWLTKSIPFRSIGAVAMDKQFISVQVHEAYDLVIYIEKTTPSRLLK